MTKRPHVPADFRRDLAVSDNQGTVRTTTAQLLDALTGVYITPDKAEYPWLSKKIGTWH